MLLQKIMEYCSEKRWVDTVSIAQYFGRELSAVEGLFETLECKSLVKSMTGGCGAGKCRNCITGCTPGPKTIRYMWVG